MYDQIKSKVALSYEYLGEQEVKNIAEPVRAYRVRWEATEGAAPASAPFMAGSQEQKKTINNPKATITRQKRITVSSS